MAERGPNMQSSTRKRTSKIILSLSHSSPRHHCPRPPPSITSLSPPQPEPPSASPPKPPQHYLTSKYLHKNRKNYVSWSQLPPVVPLHNRHARYSPFIKRTTQKNQKHDDACYKLVKIYPARYSPFSPSLFFPSLRKKNPAQEEEENDKKNITLGEDEPTPPGRDMIRMLACCTREGAGTPVCPPERKCVVNESAAAHRIAGTRVFVPPRPC